MPGELPRRPAKAMARPRRRRVRPARSKVKSAFSESLSDVLRNVPHNMRHLLDGMSSRDPHARMIALESFLKTTTQIGTFYIYSTTDLFAYFARRDPSPEVQRFALKSIMQHKLLRPLDRFKLGKELRGSHDKTISRMAREMQREAEKAFEKIDYDERP